MAKKSRYDGDSSCSPENSPEGSCESDSEFSEPEGDSTSSESEDHASPVATGGAITACAWGASIAADVSFSELSFSAVAPDCAAAAVETTEWAGALCAAAFRASSLFASAPVRRSM